MIFKKIPHFKFNNYINNYIIKSVFYNDDYFMNIGFPRLNLKYFNQNNIHIIKV
jgi:hypothetical protein